MAFEAGMTITIDEALKVSPVWCAMDTIVRSVAPCPWNVYDLKDEKRTLRPKDQLTYILNTRANPWTTAIAFREALLWSALGYGNGYAEIQLDLAGRVSALWNLHPEQVTPRFHPESRAFMYEVRQPTGETIWVDPSRIFHLRGTSRSGYAGDNVLARAARSIATAAAAQQFAAAYFANGTVLSGYFTYGKVLDPDTKTTLEKDWKEKHSGGPGAKHKSPILPPGMEFKALGSEPEKSQLLESRQFSVPDVARWFGVPLHLMMDPQGSQGYGTNIETAGIQFVNGTLHPWAERHEQEADWKLLPERPATRETRIDLARHTRGDFKSRAEGSIILKKGGVLSQNQILEDFGWNTVGSEGDVILVETTMQTLERAIEGPPEPDPRALPFGSEADPEEPTPSAAPIKTRPPSSVARIAVALDRFERKISARRIDLERNAPEKVAANLADLRAQLEPSLLAECERALTDPVPNLSDRVSKAADAVLAGEPAHLAAERMAE
jgi:HK97 family phage portal protein